MPRLSNVTLKAMALTKDPATRRPFHAMKTASKEGHMAKGTVHRDVEEVLQDPSSEVLKSLSEVVLEKSAGDADAEAAAEAIGRVLAVSKGLTHADLLAIAHAVGVEKTAGAEDKDDEGDDVDDEDMDEEKKTPSKGKGKKNPFADMKKSAGDRVAELLKSARQTEIAKAVEAMQAEHAAEREAARAEIAKARREVAEERDYRMANIIKSEMQATFKNLGVDYGKLASVVKHARESGNKAHAADLLQVLKAADAQVGLARKSGGSVFSAVGKTTSFEGNGSSAMDRINQHVDSIVQKGEIKKSRPELVDDFLKTAEGQDLWMEHIAERRG